MDESPTTEEHGGLNWDQQLTVPDVKSGITLPEKISELRWKLAHKAKQEPGEGQTVYAKLQRLGLRLL